MTKVKVGEMEVDLYDFAKSGITGEQMAEVFEDWLNNYSSPFRKGEEMGKKFARSHRTLQGLVVNLMLSALMAMASDYSDPRNEVAMKACKFIKDAFDKGSINFQPFI